MKTTRNICFLLFDDVEVLDFSGPFDVFSNANLMTTNFGRSDDPPPFKLFTVSETGKQIKTAGGLNITPDYGFQDNLPSIDVLIIPGSMDFTHSGDNKAVLEWINQQSESAEITASICVGAFLLVYALQKKLDGRQITTHHNGVDLLNEITKELNIAVDIVPGVRYIGANNIWTSGGVSSGIDLAVFLLARLTNQSLADKTANFMEYNKTTNWDIKVSND